MNESSKLGHMKKVSSRQTNQEKYYTSYQVALQEESTTTKVRADAAEIILEDLYVDVLSGSNAWNTQNIHKKPIRIIQKRKILIEKVVQNFGRRSCKTSFGLRPMTHSDSKSSQVHRNVVQKGKSEIAKIFNQSGWLAPSIITAKPIIQYFRKSFQTDVTMKIYSVIESIPG
ncbi:hypothetical protein JTB14_035058 [Gonioctena quinquepunctata]|nr:hypothetical protein JTB14_035058 [Gonioctena quinquepunctata]